MANLNKLNLLMCEHKSTTHVVAFMHDILITGGTVSKLCTPIPTPMFIFLSHRVNTPPVGPDLVPLNQIRRSAFSIPCC